MALDFTLPVVYLARHGTPDWNRPGPVYHLPPGPALISRGLEEAGELALFLHGADVRWLIVSPLERCLQTAQMVNSVLKASWSVDERLGELQPRETDREVMQRIWPVFAEAYEQSRVKGPVALITHGGVVHLLLRRFGMTDHEFTRWTIFDHSNPIPPAGAWRVTGSLAGNRWQLQLAFAPNHNHH